MHLLTFMKQTIYHNIERLSNVFVTFLDSRKVFDTVWRKGLMIKLHELCATGRIWSLINNCYMIVKAL